MADNGRSDNPPAEPAVPAGSPKPFRPKKATFVVPDPELPRFEEQDRHRVVGEPLLRDVDDEAQRFTNLTPPVVHEEVPEDEREEPFLETATAMRPTAVFGLYLGIAGLLLIGSWMASFWNLHGAFVYGAAGVAALIVLYLGISLMSAKAAADQIRIQATRTIESEKVERGKLIQLVLSTEGSYFPSGLKVLVTDQKSPGLRPVEPPVIEGVGEVRYKVRPQARGNLSFYGLDVRARARNGLWVQDQSWRIRTPVEVSPSTGAVSWNAVLCGYVPFDKDAPKELVKIFREVEHEEQRDYQPGDRMKDVDWRRVAITGQMTIRRRWVDPETTVLFVFDMGQSMLMDQAGFRNLDLAVEIAQEMMFWALRRNHEVGLVAFNEDRVIDHVRPSRSKIQYKILSEHLQYICDHKHPAEWGADGPPKIKIIGDPENLRMAMGNGIKKRNTATCTIIFFSDMQTVHEDVINTLSKSAESGIPVIGMFMPPPSLRPYRLDDKRDASEIEMRGEEQGRGMRDMLLARGAEFLEVNPFPEETALFTEEELEAYRQELLAQEEEAAAEA